MDGNDLVNAVRALSVNDTSADNLIWNDKQSKLKEIERNYESIFFWDIKKRTNNGEGHLTVLAEKMQEKYDILEVKNEFDLKRYCLKLVISYELYNNGKYKESLMEIHDIINHLESCKFDKTFQQYKNVFKHIAHSTYACIALLTNHSAKQVLKNIKPLHDFSQEEKSAVCAIKAYVFVEYPPDGNFVALEFASEARELHPSELQWIIIWIISKLRVRRFRVENFVYDQSEIDAAEKLLCAEDQKPEYFIQAAMVYTNTAYGLMHMKGPRSTATKYFSLANDNLTKVLKMEKENINHISYVFNYYMRLPFRFRSKQLIEETVEKLQNINNYYVLLVLGVYYYKIEKDYEKSKQYCSRAMHISGTFTCAIQLLKAESLLQHRDQFPIIQTLNMIYDIFPTPKRRLIILTLALEHYCHREDNPKELMHYLKLFLDQDLDDELKKRTLFTTHPLNSPTMYENGKFLSTLTDHVKYAIDYYEWSHEEKTTVVDTFRRFMKMVNENELKEYNGMKFNWRKRQDQYPKYLNQQSSKTNDQNQSEFCNASNDYNNSSTVNEFTRISWRTRQNEISNSESKSMTNGEPNEKNTAGRWTKSRTCCDSIFGPRRGPKPNTK